MKGKVFTAQEVQAILNGSKVMFREVIKPQPIQPEGFSDAYFDCYNKGNQWNWWTKDNKQLLGQIVKCPYQVGQKIFCKETFCPVNDEQFGEKNWIDYRATPKYAKSHPAGWDNEPDSPEALKWKPAQHMKQEHSRIILQIKSIGVEKLADISEEDAIKEGMEKTGCLYLEGKTAEESKFVTTEISDFRENWNATHKKPEEKFEASPWVWKVEMEMVRLIINSSILHKLKTQLTKW